MSEWACFEVPLLRDQIIGQGGESQVTFDMKSSSGPPTEEEKGKTEETIDVNERVKSSDLPLVEGIRLVYSFNSPRLSPGRTFLNLIFPLVK